MFVRLEEEMMGLVGDEDYEDDFEENEDQGRRGFGFEFEDKMVFRVRFFFIGQYLLEDVDISRNVDSALDKMRRRGSVREGRWNFEVYYILCVYSIKDLYIGDLKYVMCM